MEYTLGHAPLLDTFNFKNSQLNQQHQHGETPHVMAEEVPNTPTRITKPVLLAQLQNSSIYENGIATWQTIQTGYLVGGVIKGLQVHSKRVHIAVKELVGRKQELEQAWQQIGGADTKICATKDIGNTTMFQYEDGRVSWFTEGSKFLFCLFPSEHAVSVDLRNKFEALSAP